VGAAIDEDPQLPLGGPLGVEGDHRLVVEGVRDAAAPRPARHRPGLECEGGGARGEDLGGGSPRSHKLGSRWCHEKVSTRPVMERRAADWRWDGGRGLRSRFPHARFQGPVGNRKKAALRPRLRVPCDSGGGRQRYERSGLQAIRPLGACVGNGGRGQGQPLTQAAHVMYPNWQTCPIASDSAQG